MQPAAAVVALRRGQQDACGEVDPRARPEGCGVLSCASRLAGHWETFDRHGLNLARSWLWGIAAGAGG